MFDETGKSISLNASGVPTIKPVERVVVDTKHPHRVYFEQVGSSTPYQQHFISSVLSWNMSIGNGALPLCVWEPHNNPSYCFYNPRA